jgi:peroxiredoxin Q/BCP
MRQRSNGEGAGRYLQAAAAVTLVALLATAAPAEMLKAGDPFPTWELPDQSGEMRSSREVAGKTYLMWFYPRAMTPGCTAEGQALRDQHPAFEKRGVVIFGVSFDEPAANAEFVRQERFPFRLLSDKGRNLGVAVGAADSPEQPAARRISYLVGPDGKVLKAYASVEPAGHAAQVLGDLP